MKKILLGLVISMVSLVSIVAQTTPTPKDIATFDVASIVVPESNTSKSSEGVFGTDVDNLVDVNGWSDIEFKNMFTSLSYGANGLELGFAKALKNSYLGLFLVGDLGFDFESTFSSGKSENTAADGTVTKNEGSGYSESGHGSQFSIGALYGLGDFGFRASIAYKGDAADAYEKEYINNAGTETKTILNTDIWRLYPELAVGYKFALGDYVFYPYSTVGIDINKNTVTVKDLINDSETKTDNDVISMAIGLGSAVDLPSKDKAFSHSAELATLVSFGFIDKLEENSDVLGVISDAVTKYNLNTVLLTPSYSLSYDGVDRLSVAFVASADLLWKNSSANQKIVYSGSESGTTKNKVYTGTFDMEPSISFGLAYDVVPSKFTFRAAASIDLPTLSCTTDTTRVKSEVTVAGNTTKQNDKGRDTVWTGSSSDCAMSFASGFSFNLTPSLMFDTEWAIVSDLFNASFETTLVEGNNNILNTLNDILIHNMRFGFSFKI